MKRYLFLLVVFGLILNLNALSEPLNLNPDPNGEEWIANLPELTEEQEAMLNQLPELSVEGQMWPYSSELPTAVDNSNTIYFRPVFSQKGGSCGQASGIGYTFTYEMAAARDVDAGLEDNQYPEHYTWNFLNHGRGAGSWYFEGWDIARDNGIPNVTTYGGMSTPSPYIEWKSNYKKYYQGMKNRTLDYSYINVSTPDGINIMKEWMDNHARGDAVGGLVNFACNITGHTFDTLAAGTPHTGEIVITEFGTGGYHAMTFVGYDDEIRYDYNGDGLYTNDIDINDDGLVDVKDWEIGAVRLVNSWGTSWHDDGFAWVMYRVLAHQREEGGITSTRVYTLNVKETNTVKMALKIQMKHTSRQTIVLSAGVADDQDATVPDETMTFSLFNRNGGDHPMRGESSGAIEIGLDVSKLYNEVGDKNARKFFLIVKEIDSDNTSTGEVISLSLIDYTDGVKKHKGEAKVTIANNTTTYVGAVRKLEWPLGNRTFQTIFPDSDGDYMCIARSENDVNVSLDKCDDSTSQKWTVEEMDWGFISIRPINDKTMCIQLQDPESDDSFLVLADCIQQGYDVLWNITDEYSSLGKIINGYDHVVRQVQTDGIITFYAPYASKTELTGWETFWQIK